MNVAQRRLQWICVDGGPHVLLPAELLATWEGCNQPSGDRVVATDHRVDGNHSRLATDYDLACAHSDQPLSLIPVGNKHALVLGIMDTMSAWLPLEREEGIDILIPIQYGGFEEDVLIRASREIPKEALRQTGFTIEVGPEGLALIGACDSGEFVYGGLLKIAASAGEYQVWTADYEPEPWDIVRIHRLLKVGS